MIDIKDLRTNPGKYKLACEQKGKNVSVDEVLELDGQCLALRRKLQDLLTEKNQAGKTIAKIKDANDRQQAIERMSQLKEQEKQFGSDLAGLEPRFEELMLNMPQPAHPDAGKYCRYRSRRKASSRT